MNATKSGFAGSAQKVDCRQQEQKESTMPVTFCGIPVVATKKPVLGRKSYNEAIKKLTPYIAEARKNGRQGIQEIADYLNEKGIKAPSGRSFTYTTLNRIIDRLWKMRLTDSTRTVSEAVSARPSRLRLGGRTSSEESLPPSCTSIPTR
jgi:hypothetical protein